MKNIAKLMLAALASIALAVPAYALDFGVSGSMSTTYNITTTTASSTSDAIGSGGFDSDGGSISFSSSHGSGDTSGTITYALDYDGDLDETVTLSGSTKSGDWTASSSIDYNRGMGGANQTAHDKPALTLTDGSATIKMGNAGHIGTAAKGGGGTAAGGGGGHNASGFDYAAGAVIGDFQGISYGASFTGGTYAVAYGQQTSGSICGGIPDVDSTPAYGATSTGLGVTYETGGIDIAFSFCSGSTSSAYDNSSSYGTTGSTMGLGVSMNMGDLTPSFSYGSVSSVGSESETTATGTAMDLTVSMALGDDSAVFQFTSSTGADASNSGSRSGIELGYSTSVGPTTLAVGYGSTSYVNADGAANVGADGYSMTDIEVNLSYSW